MFIFPLFYLKKHENNYVFEGLLYDFQISEVSEELRQRVAQEEEVRAEMLWR